MVVLPNRGGRSTNHSTEALAALETLLSREWRCGLAERGIDVIDPVPLVPPDKVPPPRELAEHLHFNDWVLAYVSGTKNSTPEA
jgi:hypothetical protein